MLSFMYIIYFMVKMFLFFLYFEEEVISYCRIGNQYQVIFYLLLGDILIKTKRNNTVTFNQVEDVFVYCLLLLNKRSHFTQLLTFIPTCLFHLNFAFLLAFD